MAEGITEYMQTDNGSRRRSFEVDGVRVIVEPHDDDGRACRIAHLLYGAKAEIEKLRLRCHELFNKVPPDRPAQLLGPRCVRFLHGNLWLLNSKDGGFASFGFQLRDWDELFRRFNVAITEHGVDEHGAYWMAAPITD